MLKNIYKQYMDTVKNVVRNVDLWKNILLNRLKYIEDSLVKFSGKIFREHLKTVGSKKVYFKVKWQKKMQKYQIVT